MLNKKILLLIFLLVLLIGTACNKPQTASPDFIEELNLNTNLNELNASIGFGDNATIYYNQSDWKSFAEQIDYVLHSALIQVARYIKPRPGLHIEIVLMDDKLFRKKIAQAHWVTAASHKGRIFVPVNEKKQIALEELNHTITHELTHAVTHDLSSGHIPAWLDEGLALLIEAQPSPGAEKRFREWLRLHKPIKLEQLEKGFTKLHFDDAGNAYIQSKYVVRYLIMRFGKNGLQTFIENFKNAADTKTVFINSFGIPLEQFEEFFESRLKMAIKSGSMP